MDAQIKHPFFYEQYHFMVAIITQAIKTCMSFNMLHKPIIGIKITYISQGQNHSVF